MADRRPPGVLIAASILDSDLGGARATRSGGPRTPAWTASTSTSWTATSCPTSRSAGRRSRPSGGSTDAPVRRPPDDLRARRAGSTQFLDAGCDSITFHVEVDAPQVRPALAAIREAGRSAGLSVKPGDAARGPRRLPRPARHRDRDDRRARVRRPGVHGRRRRREAAPGARAGSIPPGACEVQVDGGGRAETAEVIGRGGTDVIVAGSALYRAPDMAAEVERIRAIADAAARRDRRAPVAPGAGRARAPAAGQPRRGAGRRRRGRARSGPGCSSSWASATATTRRRPMRWRGGSASCGSSRTRRAGRTARCSTSAARRWS